MRSAMRIMVTESTRQTLMNSYPLLEAKRTSPRFLRLPVFIFKSGRRFNGWNLSVVESLDTMWIMELYDDFRDAIPIVAQTSFEVC
jgi:hypothetical protein